MINFLMIIGEIILLFIISRRLHQNLYTLLYKIFRSKEVAIGFLTILYLPGTIIHELSHLFVAEVLRVPTRDISFTPQLTTDNRQPTTDNQIRMGSVNISQTDPIRRFLIGIAPVLCGLAALSLLIWLFQYLWSIFANDLSITTSLPPITWSQLLLLTITYYLLFSISSNMFSSPRDLEGAIFVIPTVLIILTALYIAGVRITLTGRILELTLQILDGLSKALGIVLVANLLLFLLNSLLLRLFKIRP